MTKEECLAALAKLSKKGRGDYESTHNQADGILISFIDDVEIENAYNDVGKWYA